MICSRCEKQEATVKVDEITSFVAPGHPDNKIEVHEICEVCAQKAGLPSQKPPQKHAMDEIWKILQLSAKKPQTRKPTLSCEGCQTTIEELRRRGRVGCQTCYETFGDYLGELLDRMHGSAEHVGRVPGVDERELELKRRSEELKVALDRAIAEEAFEEAARLRDELARLESA